jgi:hypothetical protein
MREPDVPVHHRHTAIFLVLSNQNLTADPAPIVVVPEVEIGTEAVSGLAHRW